jgi:ADP-ribose pyrophosphatase
MPPKPWKTLSSRLVYENPWTRVREDIAEMPNGKTTLYGVVETGEAVGIVPFVDQDHLMMVRQYRYVFQEDHRWEIPTGGVYQGENLLDAAHRELQEEIGYDASDLQHIHTFFSSKSIVYEIAHIYTGRNLHQVHSVPDETEFLEIEVFPFDTVLEMVVESEIRDAMTVIGILMADRLRRASK